MSSLFDNLQVDIAENAKGSTKVYLATDFPFCLLSHNNNDAVDDLVTVKYHFTTDNLPCIIAAIDEYFVLVKCENLIEKFCDDDDWSNMKNNVWKKIVERDDLVTASKKEALVVASRNNLPLISYREEKVSVQAPNKVKLSLKDASPKFTFTTYRTTYRLTINEESKVTLFYDTVNFEETQFIVFTISGKTSAKHMTGSNDSDHSSLRELFQCQQSCRSKIIEILYRKREQCEVYDHLVKSGVVPSACSYVSRDYVFRAPNYKTMYAEEYEKLKQKARELKQSYSIEEDGEL